MQQKVFERLTIVEDLGVYRFITKTGISAFPCRRVIARCECGDVREYSLNQLKSGKAKSCGCYRRDLNPSKKHGLRYHPLYSVLEGMKKRCLNKTDHSYGRYGGRGIKICDEWLNDVTCFVEWAINNGWKKGLQIDRRNNDGNYEPDNCRFVTSKVIKL